MTYLLLTVALFGLAAAINTGSVALQQRTDWLGRRLGRRAWWVHLAVVTPGWAAFLYVQSQLGHHLDWPLPRGLWPLGWALLAVAVGLVAASFLQLGPRRTFNGAFFDSGTADAVSGATYRWLENPMYDGFWLSFVAIALIEANAAYLVLAAASYLLLNRFEARVENAPFAARVRRARDRAEGEG